MGVRFAVFASPRWLQARYDPWPNEARTLWQKFQSWRRRGAHIIPPFLDNMSLTPGDRLGVYEMVGLLGAGGLGEVYRDDMVPSAARALFPGRRFLIAGANCEDAVACIRDYRNVVATSSRALVSSARPAQMCCTRCGWSRQQAHRRFGAAI